MHGLASYIKPSLRYRASNNRLMKKHFPSSDHATDTKRGPSTESWLVPAHAHAVLQKDPIPGFSPLLHQFGGVRPLPLAERNQAHSIRILHHLHPALVAVEGTRLQRARRTFSRSGLNGFLTEFQAVISVFCLDILGRTRTKRAGFVLHKGDGSAPEYLRQRYLLALCTVLHPTPK